MQYLLAGNKGNAFPPGHPKAGIETFLENGAEWVCSEFDVDKPEEGDISGGIFGDQLHTISDPQGLTGATAGKWLYNTSSSEFDGVWWNRTRTWIFNKNGWDADIYALLS